MAFFDFTVKDMKGRKSSGTMEAADRDAAMRTLSEKNLIVTDLREIKQKSATTFLKILGMDKVTLKGEELLLFTQQMASMLNSGISLQKALNIMLADAENPHLKQIIVELSNGVGEGTPISVLLKKFPYVFSTLYVAMVEAGETGGKLPEILERLANYIEDSENLKKKVQGAFYYPMAVLAFGLIIGLFIFIYGIPQVKGIYAQLGGELPVFTKMFIALGDFLSNQWFFIVPGLIILAFLIKHILKREEVQFYIDNAKLKNRFLGVIFQKLSIARFARTFATLYSSGVPILQALDIVARSSDNKVMEKALKVVIKRLEEGDTITGPLKDSKLFTFMAISMIAAGEEAGTLSNMLNRLARFYESQVEITIKSLTDLIEPIIMVVIGAVIGVLILAMALPFMQLSSQLN